MEDKILTFEEIKALFPDEWILLGIPDTSLISLKSGMVLFHSKDYLELCFKGSEIAKDSLTTIFFTGEQQKNRKWLKVSRLSENPQTT